MMTDKWKWLHFASTGWFMLCVGYILVSALRQAGLHWWVIFSLSGYSAILVFLLVGLYIFAIFRGVDRSQKIEIEYPLTSTNCYTAFYDISPLLGGFAGYIGSIGVSRVSGLIIGIALGTLVTTFLMWIVVDPAIAFIEKLLPASRKHRLERLSRAKALRQEQKEKRERLLAEILSQDERERTRWQEALKPQAEKLAELLMTNKTNFAQAERTAVEIGANAWQIGGLSCMQQLRNMTITICGQRDQSSDTVDYIPVWWDGIGSWKSPALC
jgi:large-conductance mechanosensitive channel